ncbi:MAG: hypothetical protein D4R67_07515 [Bacteroidetes bacterium]|nr:MAG: hypothetical protein D4R67_07515 [Bacteroidota bacterium]
MSDNLHTIFSDSECPTHEELKAYLDHQLSADKRHRIEAHLADCELCSDELEGLTRLSNPGHLPVIMEELEHRITARRIRVVRLKPRLILAAAAVIALLIGVAFIFRYVVQNQQQPLLTEQHPASEPTPLQPEEPAKTDLETQAVERQPGTEPRTKKEDLLSQEKTGIVEKKSTAVAPPESLAEAKEVSLIPMEEETIVDDSSLSGAGESITVGGIFKDTSTIGQFEAAGTQLPENTLRAKGLSGSDIAWSPNHIMRQALNYYEDENFRQAAKLFQQVIRQEPDNFKAIFYLARCYAELNKDKEALKTLEKLLVDPENEYYKQALDLKMKIYYK